MGRLTLSALTLGLAISALALSGTAVVAAEPDRGWTGNIGFFVGGRWLEHSDWKPVDDQFEVGFEFDFRPISWPVNLAVDLLYSLDWDIEDGKFWDVDWAGSNLELDLGIRKYWEGLGRLRPFVGGGLALIRSRARFDVPRVSDKDSGVGYWVDGGLDVRIGPGVHLGIEARYSQADVTILGDDKNAGGVHVGAHLGFPW